MPDKICPLVQDWHGYYGSDQLLPDRTGSLLHTRDRDECDGVSIVKSRWLGRA